MSDWFTTLDGLHAQMWDMLAAGLKDAALPARRPVFATVSPDGWPEARTVVLRSAQRGPATLSVHTDLYSDKIASLRATPRAALHIWDHAQALQIRLGATVDIKTGAAVRDLWDATPDHARQSYGVTPPPGQPIGDALDYVKSPDPATFAVLDCSVQRIDLVHLGDVHRRACYTRESGWAGQWLSP